MMRRQLQPSSIMEVSNRTDPVELVRRIVARDTTAEEEMFLRYKDGVYQIIYQVVHNHSVTEDLSQESLIKALEKIRQEELREPEKLSGFICSIARFIAIDYIRKVRAAVKVEDVNAAEQVPDLSPDPYEQVLNKERAEIVRKVISEMKVQRDRDILVRYYILEEEKDNICAALGITREQFARIIFRAHQRYKELHLKIAGQT